MSIIRTVDEQVDILLVAQALGLDWEHRAGKAFQVHCPMHNDSTPSARVYEHSNSGYCWTCQEAFGPSKLLAVTESVTITRAAHILASRYGVDLTPDADLAEFRRLADGWGAGPDSDTPEARRAAGLAVRAPGRPWDDVARLLPLWDALDAGQIKPDDWLDAVRIPSITETPNVG